MNRRLGFGVVVSVLFWQMVSFAQTPLSGYVKFYHHNRWESSDAISRTGTRMQLTVSQTLGDRAAFFGSLDFDVDEVRGRSRFQEDRGANVEIYPVEMYIDLYSPWLDLRIGKQFIFWGKTEWINPTDNINPWDYANISAEIEDYRLAVNAIKADLYLGQFTLEGVFVPVFTPDRIPGMGSGMHGGGDGMPRWFGTSLPEAKLHNGQIAFRLMHNLGGVDWSVSYYRGNQHQPQMRTAVRCIPDPCVLGLEQFYPKVQIFGGDFQKVFGRWGIRGEGAYTRTRDLSGTDPWLPNPHYQTVLALDYTPTDDFGLVAQWVLEGWLKQHLESDALAWRQMHVPYSPEPRRRTSWSARLHWEPANYWSAQLIGVVNADTHDRFALAFVNYQPADALNITVGGVFFGGRPGTPFGRMADQDRLFLELKASF
ncbi:MAG: hypothetical protein GXO73_13820 [Calditrichaeota bacterium]|nr:hypothetical protein [Calditrichota bacterium]